MTPAATFGLLSDEPDFLRDLAISADDPKNGQLSRPAALHPSVAEEAGIDDAPDEIPVREARIPFPEKQSNGVSRKGNVVRQEELQRLRGSA